MSTTARDILLLLSMLLVAGAASAQDAAPPPLAVGDTIPRLDLQDQHGEPRAVDESVRFVLFSRDMDGGDILKNGIADLPEGALDARGVAYVSDISGMPRLIARLFAVPSMRRRPYSMLLDRTGESTALLPDEQGRGTLIALDALRIASIEHFDTSEALRARVEAMPLVGGEGAPPEGGDDE